MTNEPKMTNPKPTRKTLDALERVFAAEIQGRLPFQSKAKIFIDLCGKGLLQKMQTIYGGRFPVTVSGYQLTHAGRITYCESCRDEREPENEQQTTAKIVDGKELDYDER